jgi:hypothetical protein
VYVCWAEDLRMSADLEDNLLDVIDDYLLEPTGPGPRVKIDRATIGQLSEQPDGEEGRGP